MVIIEEISGENTVKIPNNLTKKSNILYLHNTETKKDYSIDFQDLGTSPFFYVFDYDFSVLPLGEYEYEIDGNKGLLLLRQPMQKTVYDLNMTFRAYEN